MEGAGAVSVCLRQGGGIMGAPCCCIARLTQFPSTADHISVRSYLDLDKLHSPLPTLCLGPSSKFSSPPTVLHCLYSFPARNFLVASSPGPWRRCVPGGCVDVIRRLHLPLCHNFCLPERRGGGSWAPGAHGTRCAVQVLGHVSHTNTKLS